MNEKHSKSPEHHTAAVSGSAGSAAEKQSTSTSMAESVTRHAQNPPPLSHRFLLCGLDSLDLGLYVCWNEIWPQVKKSLDRNKELAQAKEGFLDKTGLQREFLHLPSGKPPNYRYHLQFPEYHVYISIADEPAPDRPVQSPNVYVSLNSETLWLTGMSLTLELLQEDLAHFGGKIHRIQPSRCDIAADFLIPGGLTLPFLESHRVSRSRDTAIHAKDGVLETYYVGAPATPIRLRIYDKGKEVLKKGKKLWFRDLWETEDFVDVWRVEFQLRRPLLHQFQINDLNNLWNNIGGLWKYLSNDWCSLRLPDNEKTERRSIHPWWEEIQDVQRRLGSDSQVTRLYRGDSTASIDWYISHMAGCLPSFAARLQIPDVKEAIFQLSKRMLHHWAAKDFSKEFKKRSIKLGMTPATEGDDGAE